MVDVAKKHGLIYTSDFKAILGVDSESNEFDGIVPTGATHIEEDAFSCCAVKDISLPDSVVSVGANIFCNSTALESVKLPSGLKTLSPYMFCGCTSLKKVEMPYEISDFSEGLFSGCASLKEIPFRAGIITLPESVFEGCTSLLSLVIPDSVEKICAGAIKDCTSLKTIVLPAAMEEFEDGAIENCPSLTRLRLSDSCSFFEVSEDGTTLYRKNDDGAKTEIFTVSNKVDVEVPKFNEIDDSENPSILDFDEEAEDEEDTEENDIIFEQNEDNEQTEQIDQTKHPEQSETEQTEQSEQPEPEQIMQTENEQIKENPNEEKVEEKNMENEDMASKLADIMQQDKQYSDGDFSIMDIPEATEEEIAADKLAPSAGMNGEAETAEEPIDEPIEDAAMEETPSEEEPVEEAEEIAEPESQEVEAVAEETPAEAETPVAEEAPSEEATVEETPAEESAVEESPVAEETEETPAPEMTMKEKVADIMEQGPSEELSITDIPADEESNSESGEIISEGDTAAGVEDTESSVPVESPEASNDEESDEDLEKTVLNNLVFEADKVEQQKLDVEDAARRVLYVFAEKLDEGQFGKTFSAALTKCCHRLAEIHNYSSIFYFYGIKLDNEKFRNQFIKFMKEKDAVLACSASTLSTVSDGMRDFANCVGVELEKSEIEKQINAAHDPNSGTLKLIIQDVI